MDTLDTLTKYKMRTLHVESNSYAMNNNYYMDNVDNMYDVMGSFYCNNYERD